VQISLKLFISPEKDVCVRNDVQRLEASIRPFSLNYRIVTRDHTCRFFILGQGDRTTYQLGIAARLQWVDKTLQNLGGSKFFSFEK